MPASAHQFRVSGQSRPPYRWMAVAAACLAGLVVHPAEPVARAQEAADEPQPSDDAEDNGVFLPADRAKERQLDRVRRLVAAQSWTDAAALLDELLADDRDAFVRGDATTWRSIRSAAARMLETLPAPGREAYARLCRTRAEQALDEAIRGDDAAATAGVARRWFETPAGRRAALLTAFAAIEKGEAVAARLWLDRLAASSDAATFEPTLTVMRAAAARLAGDHAAAAELLGKRRGPADSVRIGGRDVAISGGAPADLGWLQPAGDGGRLPDAGEWLQPRGDAARNAVVEATRPLLVPRYRVPLTRHPEEARLLDDRRRAAAAAGDLVLPAATPLAVGGTIVVRAPLGILAIDFETGRRLWLRPAASPAGGEAGIEGSLGRAFDDATSGGLSSDGRLVFAVESHPDAVTPPPASILEARFGRNAGGGWRGGNSLAAYDVAAKGMPQWRLPAAAAADGPAAWYMAAPLVVGDELFVLVEERGQVRLDVLAAADGAVRWSQPLADLDERQSAVNPDAYARRRAGLAPALADGVLVCPLGGGTVVAVDMATRTLLWAHRYRVTTPPAEPPEFGRLRPVARGEADAGPRWSDSVPVISRGRVLLTPYDSDELVCLGLRDGAPAWREPPRDRPLLAGVVDGTVVVVNRGGVEGLAIDTGRRLWQRPHAAGGRPSGRGILTRTSLFLPCDAPEVVEIAVADGSVMSRRTGRGGGIPGNLVAYRGEVVSLGIDAVDVFHQSGSLESRIETASRTGPDNPWATYWRGQMELDGGDVGAALERLRQAAAQPAARVPPGAVADAMVFAMRRDFAAAVRGWERWPEAAAAAPDVARVACDGFLERGDFANAWTACRALLATAGDESSRPLIADPSDAAVEVHPDRWIRGRLARLAARAPQEVREQIAAHLDTLAATAAVEPDAAVRIRRLQSLVDRLGQHPAAAAAREALGAAIDGRVAADGDLPRGWELRREMLRLQSEPPTRGDTPADPEASEWPLGRVEVRSPRGDRQAAGTAGSQVVALPILGETAAPVPGIAVAYDMQRRRLLVTDGYGRRVTEPLPIDGARSAAGLPWIGQSSPIEPSVVGRILFVRNDGGLTAFDVGAAAGEGRIIWRHAVGREETRDLVPVRPHVGAGGRVARDGGVPLGRRITEPDDLAGGPASVQGAAARPVGVLVPMGRSVALLDPVSGHPLWVRHDLPAVSEWLCDDEFACGCTMNGRGSVVLSMHDGRVVHHVDVPHRRQRLGVHGRRIVAIVPLDDGPVADRVRLDLVDPADRESRPLGEFAGAARATAVGQGRVAVVEPSGGFTVLDIAAGGVEIRTELPAMPPQPQSLAVTAWHDRYLVFVGIADRGPAAEWREGEGISPLQELLLAGEATAVTSGAVWAVDRVDGRMLWQHPATISRHALHLAQPAGLPLLLFCRQVAASGDARPWLSLLGIDKRTGHAVLEDDRVPVQQHMVVGCEMVGSPADHTITVRGANETTRPVILRFTGEPMPPRPPFQASGRAPSSSRGIEGLGRSLERPAAGGPTP